MKRSAAQSPLKSRKAFECGSAKGQPATSDNGLQPVPVET